MMTMPERWALVPVEPTEAIAERIRGLRAMADNVRGAQPAVARLLEDSANAFSGLLFRPGGSPVDPTQDEKLVETVARAFCDHLWGDWAFAPDARQEDMLNGARAVLALVRGR
jgi:hypothetical protein